jgi:hypothetical protein
MLSKTQEATIYAYDKGYRVVGNEVISPFSGKARALSMSGQTHYPRFTIKMDDAHRMVEAHKLSAYQKFGDKAFEDGKIIRHLNTNPLNFRESNLKLMTRTESNLLIPEEDRKKHATNASKKARQFDNAKVKEIREFHAEHKSYKKTMDKFDISSSGSLHNILTRNYVT